MSQWGHSAFQIYSQFDLMIKCDRSYRLCLCFYWRMVLKVERYLKLILLPILTRKQYMSMWALMQLKLVWCPILYICMFVHVLWLYLPFWVKIKSSIIWKVNLYWLEINISWGIFAVHLIWSNMNYYSIHPFEHIYWRMWWMW